MRAMVLPAFGGPELFELRDVERPRPGSGEILVKVIATSVNPVDAKIRASGTWAQLTPPVILGYDAAGIVEETGHGVNDFKPGDEVYYTPEIMGNQSGTYAEYNAVKANIVAHKPKGLSFEEASAIPLAGGVAWEAVVRRLNVRVGETVLIQAGAGGVGSYAVQYAKASGARVLASASAGNRDVLEKLGVDVIIDYKTQDAAEVALEETGGRGVDAVFDIEGPNLVSRSLRGIRMGGQVACIIPPVGDLSLLYQRNITLHGVFLMRERGRLDEMSPVFERGLVKPLIDQVMRLEDLRQAHERLDTRHGKGKIVLKVADAG